MQRHAVRNLQAFYNIGNNSPVELSTFYWGD